MKWGGIKAARPTPVVRLQLLPERLKVKTTRQPDVRGQAPWGLRAGWCIGSTRSSWSPVFENGSLCSLEAPCNPSASVFPSAEGETSRSFWLLNNYLWVTLKIQGAGQNRGRNGKKPTGNARANTDVGCIKQEQVTLLWVPVSYFLPQGESGWWEWLAAAGWARDCSANLCKWAAWKLLNLVLLMKIPLSKLFSKWCCGPVQGRNRANIYFLPGKSKQANTHTSRWLRFSESISKGQNLHNCHKL